MSKVDKKLDKEVDNEATGDVDQLRSHMDALNTKFKDVLPQGHKNNRDETIKDFKKTLKEAKKLILAGGQSIKFIQEVFDFEDNLIMFCLNLNK